MLNINTILNNSERKLRLIREAKGIMNYELKEESVVILQVLVDEINKELAKLNYRNTGINNSK